MLECGFSFRAYVNYSKLRCRLSLSLSLIHCFSWGMLSIYLFACSRFCFRSLSFMHLFSHSFSLSIYLSIFALYFESLCVCVCFPVLNFVVYSAIQRKAYKFNKKIQRKLKVFRVILLEFFNCEL